MKVTRTFVEQVIATSKIVSDLKSSHHIESSIKLVNNPIKSIRDHNLKKIKQILDNEMDDSALFCPISLFGTMEMGRLEVAHTRTLGWLISPKESHGFGHELTKSFLKLFGLSHDFSNIQEVFIETEKQLFIGEESYGRADIYVSIVSGTTQHTLIVEAKIDSILSKQQYKKYMTYLQHVSGHKSLGVLVTEEALNELEFVDSSIVTYQQVYKAFLDTSRSLSSTNGAWFLKYYLAGIAQDILHLPKIRKNNINENELPYQLLKMLR
jgi:hypothetical protein